MKCINCNSEEFYSLKNDYIKCKLCAKKYSLKKLKTNKECILAFCENKSALETSKNLSINYRTVKNRYDELRFKISKFLEEEYLNSIKDNSQYEEYYYFNKKQKSQKRKSLYEAINIMGFYSNEKIYTLLMPKLSYKTNTNEEGFEAYLNWHKIHSQDAYKTKLKEFWFYLEENLKKYKGLDKDNFFYYLKESEFKFNYSKEEQSQILLSL